MRINGRGQNVSVTSLSIVNHVVVVTPGQLFTWNLFREVNMPAMAGFYFETDFNDTFERCNAIYSFSVYTCDAMRRLHSRLAGAHIPIIRDDLRTFKVIYGPRKNQCSSVTCF